MFLSSTIGLRSSSSHLVQLSAPGSSVVVVYNMASQQLVVVGGGSLPFRGEGSLQQDFAAAPRGRWRLSLQNLSLQKFSLAAVCIWQGPSWSFAHTWCSMLLHASGVALPRDLALPQAPPGTLLFLFPKGMFRSVGSDSDKFAAGPRVTRVFHILQPF